MLYVGMGWDWMVIIGHVHLRDIAFFGCGVVAKVLQNKLWLRQPDWKNR